MKPGNAFGDRARLLAEWFQDWNSCEQTIALYSLLSKVSATQARFLSLVLEHSLKNGCESQELSRLEKQANSSAYLSMLHKESEASALTHLLSHLPLLHPGNSEARGEYMKLLPKVLLGSSEEIEYLDQCRQLLSLALVHPAFPHEDREALTYWLARLDEKSRGILERNPSQRPPPLPPRGRRIHQMAEDPSRVNGGGRIYINGNLGRSTASQLEGSLEQLDALDLDDDDRSRANSLGPGQSLYGGTEPPQLPPRPSASTLDDYSSHMFMPSSKTSSLPIPRTASGGGLACMLGSTDELGAQLPPIEWAPGMKDVPMWLKSLRLHKYQQLFAELGYEEMLQLPEEFLEDRGVTKGARNKIILSIRKLARRPETLGEIEQDMKQPGRLLPCINELYQMLRTPIKPYNPSDSGEETDRKHRQRRIGKMSSRLKAEPLSGDEEEGMAHEGEEESYSSNESPQRSSSDNGSDLEELLARDFPNEDLPSLITRAIGKAYHHLMLHTETNEENLGNFIKVLDLAMVHEAFNVDRRKMFFDWKQHSQQTLKVISPSKKCIRGRNWTPGTSYTFHGLPSQHPSRGGKSRSLRPVRNGGMVGSKLSVPLNAPRTSSTLPRMSTRALQQPLPPTSFLRPKSTTISFPASPSHMSPQAKPFVPNLHGGGSAFAPPPLPPRTAESTEMYMDDLCKRVTDHVVDDLSDN